MTTTEQTAKNPIYRAGVFAMLGPARDCAGARAPMVAAAGKRSHRHLLRMLLVALLATLGVGSIAAAPALAAGPEMAETLKPEPISPTEATLEGVINPKATFPTEAGTYQFLYKATKTATRAECESAGASRAPASPGIYFGVESEFESEPVSGLAEGTEYVVCLAATTAGGTTVGSAFTFQTGIKLEAPVAGKVKVGSITATTAEVEGELNPGKERKVDQGSFEVIYKISALSAPATEECEENATPRQSTSGAKEEKVSERLTNLEPNAKYTFCLRVVNEDGEEATGAAVTFTTAAAPPTILEENVSHVKATEATLEGIINPSNQLTECHFQYGIATVSEHELPCSPELLSGYGEQNVSPTTRGQNGGEVPAPITGLEVDKVYKYRIVTSNGDGEVADGPVKEFKKLAAPPEAPRTEEAKAISNTTAELRGIVNPATASSVSWFFQHAAGPSCTGSNATATPVQGPEEVQALAAGASITALQPHTEYTACLVAENESKERTLGNDVSFTTTALAPSVDDEFISVPGFTDVTLTAKINPHGSSARYYFEYGVVGASGASTATRPLVAAENDVTVTAELTGLQPDTSYQAKVIIEDESGRTPGAVFGFTTDAAGEAPLPDGRVYEMVTPPQNEDADIYAPGLEPFTGSGVNVPQGTGSPIQTAANGEAITYVGEPVAGGNGSSGDSSPSGGTGGDESGYNFTGDQLLARRSASGWTQEVIAATGRAHSFYETFSEDLGTGILRAGSYAEKTPLLPEAEGLAGGYRVLYERNDDTQSERALFTQFAQAEPPAKFEFFPRFAGGSSDFSTKVFDANAALITGVPAGSNVYESRGGELSLLNVLPDGTVEPSAQAGGVEEAGTGLAEEGSPEFSHAVSDDGSRVFWTGTGSHPNLYMHDDGAATVQIDASQAGGAGGGGHFWTASSNGERVFFTDDAAAGLTTDTVPGSGDNLYEYDVGDGELADLTVAADARVQGMIGATEDGSYVYFVADGVLDPGATTGACDGWAGSATAECNLYVRHDGTTAFVSTVSQNDGMEAGGLRGYKPGAGGGIRGDWVTGQGLRTADVAADGTVVFQSDLSLTGYRNEGAKEVYLYDPTAAGDAGELTCVSCDPSGAPPASGGPAGSDQIAALLPVSHNTSHASRVVSADGDHVYFDAAVSLLPQDTNNQVDVYEWERAGTPDGSCPADALKGGCVYLLTAGKSDDGSFLLDSSASGNDVFVVTRAQLVEEDRNENYDVYDVRVDGVRQPTPPSCSGTGCQGVPAVPPTFATPSSVTFSGTGNFAPSTPVVVKPKTKPLTRAQKLATALRACRRKSKKQARISCEAGARKKYGAVKKKAKKTTKSTNSKGSK